MLNLKYVLNVVSLLIKKDFNIMWILSKSFNVTLSWLNPLLLDIA